MSATTYEVEIIRANGTRETVEVRAEEINEELDWFFPRLDTEDLESIPLGNGMVMLIDGDGMHNQKAENAAATELAKRCTGHACWAIVGDVALIPFGLITACEESGNE
jgi:hypothetical protein